MGPMGPARAHNRKSRLKMAVCRPGKATSCVLACESGGRQCRRLLLRSRCMALLRPCDGQRGSRFVGFRAGITFLSFA